MKKIMRNEAVQKLMAFTATAGFIGAVRTDLNPSMLTVSIIAIIMYEFMQHVLKELFPEAKYIDSIKIDATRQDMRRVQNTRIGV